MNVDEQLSALFSGLDARPGFNERLLERLHQEIVLEAQRAEEARRQEQLRHRVAQQELRPWRQTLGNWVTLETVGIAVLAGITVTSAWSADQIRQAIPYVFTAIGIALAAAPVIAPKLRAARAP